MRRATLLLLATIAGILLTTGVALAANFYGDENNNVLYGRDSDDALYGRGGADYINGAPGNDILYGGSGHDNYTTTGLSGKDKFGNPITGLSAGLRGGAGNDTVYGQAGDDDIIGNRGKDRLYDSADSADKDRAFGGTEDDYINLADGDIDDQAICGDGIDTAKIDVVGSAPNITDADEVYDCEKIIDKAGKPVDKNDLPQNDPTSASFDQTAPVEPTG